MPRKTLKQRREREGFDEFQFEEEVGSNRIAPYKTEIQAMGNPEDRMLMITELLTDIQMIPDVGDYYTFIYNAKTKGFEYDQHPLIACVDIQRVGISWAQLSLGVSLEIILGKKYQDSCILLELVN